jgi:hypothetical protein
MSLGDATDSIRQKLEESDEYKDDDPDDEQVWDFIDEIQKMLDPAFFEVVNQSLEIGVDVRRCNHEHEKSDYERRCKQRKRLFD